jgi:hypothetical protein
VVNYQSFVLEVDLHPLWPFLCHPLRPLETLQVGQDAIRSLVMPRYKTFAERKTLRTMDWSQVWHPYSKVGGGHDGNMLMTLDLYKTYYDSLLGGCSDTLLYAS